MSFFAPFSLSSSNRRTSLEPRGTRRFRPALKKKAVSAHPALGRLSFTPPRPQPLPGLGGAPGRPVSPRRSLPFGLPPNINLARPGDDAFRRSADPPDQRPVLRFDLSAASATGAARRLLRAKQQAIDLFLHYHIDLKSYEAYDSHRRRRQWPLIAIPPYEGDWPGHPKVKSGSKLDMIYGYDRLANIPRQNAPLAMLAITARGGAAAAAAPIAAPTARMRRAMDRVKKRFNRMRAAASVQPDARRNRREDPPRRPGVPLPGTERQPPMIQRLAERLADQFEPAGLRFKRLLGMGGFGAVFLFELVGQKGKNIPIVIKGSLKPPPNDHQAFLNEINHLAMMNGSAHFIQCMHLSDLPVPTRSRTKALRTTALTRAQSLTSAFKSLTVAGRNAARPSGARPNEAFINGLRQNPPPPPQQRAPRPLPAIPATPPGYTREEFTQLMTLRANLDLSDTMVLLENMARGDAYKLVKKLLMLRTRLSNRALWAIFQCLFKACVGMATPGRFFEDGKDAWMQSMTPRDETVLGQLFDGTRVPRKPMVHFDLDPQNVLFGDFGKPGSVHENVPICKVSDPGLAERVDDTFRNDEYTLWRSRTAGKVDHFTPEQFTSEWDYQASISLDNLHKETTAGNYNWWTNLYQIGWVMWELVTHCFPPTPPYAYPYRYAREGTRVKDRDGHSYGLHVMGKEFDAIDSELRYYIVRCLDHKPEERPTMGWMEAVMMANNMRPSLLRAESDEQLRAEMDFIFGDPC